MVMVSPADGSNGWAVAISWTLYRRPPGSYAAVTVARCVIIARRVVRNRGNELSTAPADARVNFLRNN